MKNYVVILASDEMRGDNVPTCRIEADRIRELSASIEFYRGDEKTARFQTDKIVGWYERFQ